MFGLRAVGRWTLAAFLLFSCTGDRSTSDKNTNWLNECRSGAECGNGLECLGGMCTVSCGRDRECSGYSRDAVCAALPERCALGGAPRVCTLGCTRSASCALRNDALVCVAGACAPEACAGREAGASRDSGVPRATRDASLQKDAGRDVDAAPVPSADAAPIPSPDAVPVPGSDAATPSGKDGATSRRDAGPDASFGRDTSVTRPDGTLADATRDAPPALVQPRRRGNVIELRVVATAMVGDAARGRLDVRDPENPSLVGKFPFTGTTTAGMFVALPGQDQAFMLPATPGPAALLRLDRTRFAELSSTPLGELGQFFYFITHPVLLAPDALAFIDEDPEGGGSVYLWRATLSGQ